MSYVNEVTTIIKDHIGRAGQANKHPAKLLVLSKLLEELFGVGLEELIPGIETKLGSKLWGLRGSADLIFSNMVFEVKVHLDKELDDAIWKLKKYLQVLYECEPQRKSIGMATDALEFKAYIPIVKDGQVVDLSEIGSINITVASPSEITLWLDAFIFSTPKIKPSAQDLKWRFGPGSPTYSISKDGFQSLWHMVESERDAKLKLDLWAKNMEIVYGGKPELSSFMDHGYLVTLVKLIVYLRLSGDNVVNELSIKRALTGEYFSSYGITNLIEEDFFAWILNPKIAGKAIKLVYDIAKELLRYDFSQVDEDFFKEIYQGIVERGERHRIGEYYTPEWLVQLTLREAIDLWREEKQDLPRILDPACGSGTFLCNAIYMIKKELQNRGESSDQILDLIIRNVVGVDINPLATVIAKANYLIALGNLLQLGRPIIIPIYVADSVQTPKVLTTLATGGSITVYQIDADGYPIQMPKSVIIKKSILGKIFEAFKDASNAYKVRADRNEALEIFKRRALTLLSEDEFEVLKSTLNTVLMLMDRGLDSIWIFMLNNIYAPLTLMESQFDIIVGNPPWISMMYIGNESYQDFVKQQVFSYTLLDTDQVHLFANMEIASLFFCKTNDLYLKDNGIIAFVMPRSVLTGALHHIKFMQFKKPKQKLIKILDLEDVSPLFNVPSCVLIAKKGEITTYPILARRYAGNLSEKNAKLVDAIKQLSVEDYTYQPVKISTEHSWYYNKIKEGAPIRPRSLWFIDFDVHPVLGINVLRPSIKTSKEVLKQAKARWKEIELQGSVEIDFVYITSLGRDLVSFSFRPRFVILPIEPTSTGFKLLSVNVLRSKGFSRMADWLEKVERIWKKRRTKKSELRFPSILNRLDYNSLLSIQNPNKRYIFIYNAHGTNLVSCVIDRFSLPDIQVLRTEIRPKFFISEDASWYYETNDEFEAHYICSVLNSSKVNEWIKPLQPRGTFGERSIHRRPFMLPIPKFDGTNPLHVKLAELSKQCHSKVASIKFAKKSIVTLRKNAREALRTELDEINQIVQKLLGI